MEKLIQFNNLKFTPKEFKSLNLAIIKRTVIYARLIKIEKSLLRENGHACFDCSRDPLLRFQYNLDGLDD
jgi:hypothetical protein